MSGTEKIVSVPIALTLLLGLASAAVSNQALKKAFPATAKPSRLTPRRVVIRSTPDADEGESVEPAESEYMPEKAANYRDALEHLLEFSGRMPSAGPEIMDMIKGAATGRYAEMREVVLNVGPDCMFSVVKGAGMQKSASEADNFKDMLAVGLLANSSVISPVAGLMAAAEFTDAFPGLAKFAASLDEHVQDNLIGMLACYRRAQRHDLIGDKAGELYTVGNVKSATFLGNQVLMEKLMEMGLKTDKKDIHNPGAEAESVLSSEGETSDDVDVDVQDSRASRFAADKKDLIDSVLGGRQEKAPYIVFAEENRKKKDMADSGV